MITTMVTNNNIKKAVEISNQLYKESVIKNLIKNHPKFDFTNQTSVSIAEIVQSFWALNDFQVKTYRPWWRWSKAVASTSGSREFSFNVYKLSSYVPDLVATIVHESIHAANFHVNPHMNPKMAIFGHGDNSPVGKRNSVPYWIQSPVVIKAVEILG